VKTKLKDVENLALTRLSKNFILRDFLYSTTSAVLGFPNTPDDPQMVIRAGQSLCQKILEPLLAQFGKFSLRLAINVGLWQIWLYLLPISATTQTSAIRTSGPLHLGSEVYARVDIWPFCVETARSPKSLMETG